jgi:hypothetical protein
MAGAFVASLAFTGRAPATPTYLNAFIARYPTSTLPARMLAQAGRDCYVCHQPTSMSNVGNCYRMALRDRLLAGRTIEQALGDVEGMDSDGDGVANGVEITLARTDLPGQVGYNPGLIGATGTDPCWTNPAAPVSNQRETPILCYANCDASTTLPLLNVNDFVCFQSRFAAADPYADCNHDTLLNVNDFVCFQSAFAAGCP